MRAVQEVVRRRHALATGAGDKQSVNAAIAALEASDWTRFADLGVQTRRPPAPSSSRLPGLHHNDRRLT
jgi:hypothetical protein